MLAPVTPTLESGVSRCTMKLNVASGTETVAVVEFNDVSWKGNPLYAKLGRGCSDLSRGNSDSMARPTRPLRVPLFALLGLQAASGPGPKSAG